VSTPTTATGEGIGVPAKFDRDVDAVLTWARGQQSIPIPIHWVPGATDIERQQLSAIGALVGDWFERHGGCPLDRKDDAVLAWLSAQAAPSPEVCAALDRLTSAGVDAVADLYATCVSGPGRRHLGTFFTPTPEAQWMTQRWHSMFGAPASVVDVGAGVGVFTSLAARQWPDATVHAVDINPVTLGLLLMTSATEPGDVRPVLDDYITWLDADFPTLSGPRLVIGNPPYTRLQLIPPADRERLLGAARGLCGARASLSALILAATLLQLAPADGACLLLPAQWLEADYAVALRGWLWSAQDRRVEVHLFDSNLFADAQVDAVCLIVGPSSAAPADVVVSIAKSNGGTVTTADTAVDRSGVCPPNWRHLSDPAAHDDQTGRSHSRPLSSVARIRRGTATGANWFFTLTEDHRLTHRIPRSALVPYLQRTHALLQPETVTASDVAPGGRLSRSWLLHAPAGGTRAAETQAYLTLGEQAGVPGTHLASSRKTWHDLTDELVVPDVIVSASARTGFVFAVNEADAAITNNLYGLTWLDPDNNGLQRRVLDWLRSHPGQTALRRAARIQAGGLQKIEIHALGQLLIPGDVLSPS
jgi:predicted RNA methylase